MRNSNHHEEMIRRLEQQREKLNARIDAQQKRLSEKMEHQRAKLEIRLTTRQEEIIKAALEVLDRQGLESVTLRSLAKHLDIKAPAIYWHFQNKVSLIDYLAEAILKEEFPDITPRPTDTPWEEWLTTMILRLRHAMLSHNDGARIVAGAHLYPAQTLAKFIDVGMQSLVSAGMTIRQADLIVSTAVHFTFGRVIEEQSMPSAKDLEEYDIPHFLEQYPYLEKSVKESHAKQDFTHDTDFKDSLQLIINGYKQIP